MKDRSGILRIVLGALVAPWIYIVAWTIPVLGHSAFHKWVVINTALAYVIFMLLAGISHFALVRLGATKIWSYCIVMFTVALSIDFILSLWSLSWYTSLYYAQTQVVENHSITSAGYMLQIKEALIHGVISASAMAVFWFVAIFKSQGKVQHA